MNYRFVSLFIAILGVAFTSFSREVEDSTIVDVLNARYPDKITIIQPEGMNERLMPDTNHTSSHSAESSSTTTTHATSTSHTKHLIKVSGYRIQVYADNNPRAKNEALVKERNLVARFPHLPTYLSYKAPVWRLKVGNFRTHHEAQEMLSEIRKVLPTYARECIIVRDRINILQ